MSRIFISYQSDDKALAFEICRYLEEKGLCCWIAPRDICAGEYASQITKALKSARFFVLVCSGSTSSSPHVKSEVSMAFAGGCRIVPFFSENTLLDDSLEYFLAGKQRIYLTSDKEKSFSELHSVIISEQIVLSQTVVDFGGKRGRNLLKQASDEITAGAELAHNTESSPKKKTSTSMTTIMSVILTVILAAALVSVIARHSRMPEGKSDGSPADNVVDTMPEVPDSRLDSVRVAPRISHEVFQMNDADTFTDTAVNVIPDSTGTCTL